MRSALSWCLFLPVSLGSTFEGSSLNGEQSKLIWLVSSLLGTAQSLSPMDGRQLSLDMAVSHQRGIDFFCDIRPSMIDPSTP
jgi:hypothetical protein